MTPGTTLLTTVENVAGVRLPKFEVTGDGETMFGLFGLGGGAVVTDPPRPLRAAETESP